MAELLIHSDDVPSSVRAALEAARRGPAEERFENLRKAAQGLHHEVGLDCHDALELVGLDDRCACAC